MIVTYYFQALLIAIGGYFTHAVQGETPQNQAVFAAKPAKTEKYKVQAKEEGKVRLINEKTGKPYVTAGDSVTIGQTLYYLETDENSSHQVKAERSGKLISIKVTNKQAVKENADLMTMEVLVQTAEEIFQDRARVAGMEYVAPAGFEPTEVKDNPDMYYQWAIRHKTKKLEIRYFIYDLKEDLRAYEENKLGDGSVTMADPNNLYYSISFVNVLNTAAGDGKQLNKLPDEMVINKFHADWGAGQGYTPRPTFAPGYKKCMLFAIHKKNKADAHIVFLLDDEKEVENELIEAMYNLRFRK